MAHNLKIQQAETERSIIHTFQHFQPFMTAKMKFLTNAGKCCAVQLCVVGRWFEAFREVPVSSPLGSGSLGMLVRFNCLTLETK